MQATVLRERRGRGWGEQILEHRGSAVLVPEALAQAMSPGAPAAPSAGRGIRRTGGGGPEGAGPRAGGRDLMPRPVARALTAPLPCAALQEGQSLAGEAWGSGRVCAGRLHPRDVPQPSGLPVLLPPLISLRLRILGKGCWERIPAHAGEATARQRPAARRDPTTPVTMPPPDPPTERAGGDEAPVQRGRAEAPGEPDAGPAGGPAGPVGGAGGAEGRRPVRGPAPPRDAAAGHGPVPRRSAGPRPPEPVL